MLTKLMKYEWKAVWRMLLIINAFTAAITIIGMIALHSPLLTKDFMLTEDAQTIAILLFITYYAVIIGVSFAVMIYTGIRFYRSLFTDEGYLMHTLPVTNNQLIFSRLIIHSFSYLVTGILVFVSVCVLFFPLASILAAEENIGFSELYSAASVSISTAFGMSIGSIIGWFTVSMVLGSISAIMTIYAAICIGQTFQRHKIIASILCYLGLTFVMQTLSTVMILPQTFALNASGASFSMGQYMYSVLLLTTVIQVIFGIACYIITIQLMKKKLNLD